MARHQSTEIEISMFPFLSVLCALIGVMMLFMLMVITSRVIGSQDASRAAAAAQAAWQEKLRESPLNDERRREFDEQIRRLEQRLDDCLSKRDELRDLHAELTDLLAANEDLAELAASPAADRRSGTELGRPERVRMVPDPRRQIAKIPVLVEVTSEGFVAHPEKVRYSLAELTDSESPLAAFLEQLNENRSRQYLLLLIRPNGVTAYDQLRAYLEQRFGQTARLETEAGRGDAMDVGKEPFSLHWVVARPEDDAAPQAAEP